MAKISKCVKTFIVFLLLLQFSIAQAQTYVQVNGVSLHDQPGYNGFNYGAGLEQTVSDRWTVAGGWYRNSEYRGSTYAYGRYTVYKQGSWDVGIAMGAVTGYQRATVVPMAFPEVCYAWVCGLFAPRVESTGANALGFRLRIPVN
jgi:hypothetical protein